MKKILYGLFILGVVLLGWRIYDMFVKNEAINVSVNVTDESKEFFEEHDFKNAHVSLQGYYSYGDTYLNDIRTQNLVDEIAKRMGINSAYKYDRVEEEGKYISTLTKESKNATLKIEVTTIETEESKYIISQNSFIEIDMEIEDSVESGIYYKKEIENVMKSFCIGDNYNKIYMTVTAKKAGKIGEEEQRSLAKEYIEKMNGKLENDINNDGYYSLYGYSETLGDEVRIGNSKVNINVVFTFDEINDDTIIHIGMPIINQDY